MIGYLDPDFMLIMDEVSELLKVVFQTDESLTMALSGTGSAGMEAGLTSLLEPDDTVVMCLCGFFGERMVEMAGRVGANVVPLQPSIQDVALTPEFVHVTLPGEATASLCCEIGLLNSLGTMSACFPHPTLKPVMDTLTSQVWFSSAAHFDDEEGLSSTHQQLAHVGVPVAAELGQTSMTLRELLTLTEGQIIKLDTAPNGALPVRVGEHVKFSGRPGLMGKNLAVRIERVVGS
jgi:flagellar motor switch protein FliM